jgi:peptidoglycan/xylan/chitin deacetylase (PgdA/CDA1 family)
MDRWAVMGNTWRQVGRTRQAVHMAWGGKGVILLYHRVADSKTDPLELCVSIDHFREHLTVLSRFYHPLSLLELGQAVVRKHVCPWSVAVTFDDGYADNLHAAAPILEKFGMRGTVFVVGQVLRGKDFFYDELEDILLMSRALPAVLRFPEYGREKEWNLGSWREWPCEPDDSYWQWTISLKTNPTPRHQAYREIFTWLRGASTDVREDVLSKLRDMAGEHRYRPLMGRGMSPADLRAAEHGGVLEIGAHTYSHPVLSKLNRQEQEYEIFEGKRVLEENLTGEASSFAYPYGTSWDVGPEALQIAEQAGFTVSCANMTGTVTRGSQLHWMPRFLVRNWNGEEFAKKMEGFFTSGKIRPPVGNVE